MKLKIFFANFQTLGPLGCQGWVVISQNVKKSQNHCTLFYILYTVVCETCTVLNIEIVSKEIEYTSTFLQILYKVTLLYINLFLFVSL
jgi:hypothetical protein